MNSIVFEDRKYVKADPWSVMEHYNNNPPVDDETGESIIIARGLSRSTAERVLELVAGSIKQDGTLRTMVDQADGFMISWQRQNVEDPTVGIISQLWIVPSETSEGMVDILDEGRGCGRFPWLGGMGWIPESTEDALAA